MTMTITITNDQDPQAVVVVVGIAVHRLPSTDIKRREERDRTPEHPRHLPLSCMPGTLFSESLEAQNRPRLVRAAIDCHSFGAADPAQFKSFSILILYKSNIYIAIKDIIYRTK